MESFCCCSCVLELITGNISGLRSVFQMFCFQAALRPYSCLFRLAGFLLLPSRQFPHSVEVFCTWLLYFPVSVLYTCVRFRISFQNLISVLYRHNELSFRVCGWVWRLWLFQIIAWEKKPIFCGKAKNFCFSAHLCADSKPLEHDEELGSFLVIKIFVTV